MNKLNNISIDEYNYDLPDEKIAKFPLEFRDQSKLLIYKDKNISEDYFYNISEYIPKESLVVFNNTHVIQSRIFFRKSTGAKIEIFCLEPFSPNDYALIFSQTKKCQWKCIIGNKKKWKDDLLTRTIRIQSDEITLSAKKIIDKREEVIVEFEWNNSKYQFSDILDSIGNTPIPPYLNRESEDIDKIRYQTVYGKINGSVAAPTAGLHFTNEVFSDFIKHNIHTAEITLHVGAGTFKPVKSQNIQDHTMHTEHYVIDLKILDKLLKSKSIIATGTTTLRTLESIYWAGVKYKHGESPLHIAQWDPYRLESKISFYEAIENLKTYMINKNITSFIASTQMIIIPGYQFKAINGLITNYHQPKSTLLLLVAAFIGNDWKKVYDFALSNQFRFLSYGDSSILIP
jgi:S-adenosylmethionine:tRNA ribosyltransferase-isomerase